MSMQELPAGWKWVRLGDVCEFLDSRRLPINEAERNKRITGKEPDDLFPYFGANGQVGWIDDYLFDEPLILLAEDGGFFGSSSKPIAYAIQGKTWVNNHAHVLRPIQNRVDFNYLLHSLSIRPDVADLVSGATRLKLNQAVAKEIPIPIPPTLDEQRRIAAAIDAQMAQVARARAALEAQLDAAQQLMGAYLREVFEGEEAQGWERVRLGDVSTISAPLVDPTVDEFRDLPHVNGENMESGTGRLLNVRSVSEDGMTSGKYLFQSGDVLYSKIRPYLRKAVHVEFSGLCSADVYPVRFSESRIVPEFALWLLLSDSFTSYADSESRRARMPKLNREQFMAYEADLPSVPEQLQTASRLRDIGDGARMFDSSAQSQLAHLDRLSEAVLAAAFRGEV